MNLFNSYQAVAFYSVMPFGINWLYQNGHSGWSYVAGAAWLIGFILMGMAVHEGAKNM